MKNMFNKIQNYLNVGHSRSVAAKKNIIKLTIIKLLTIFASFLLIPLTINYVSPSDYGVWLTLSSTIAWISLFDIGINNGLRNKLTKSFSRLDIEQSQILVSTTYALLLIVFLPLLVLLWLANYFTEWTLIFNLSIQKQQTLKMVAAILIAYFCIRFILSTVNTVLLATQNAAKAAYSGFFEQLFLLALVYVFSKTLNGTLENLAMAVFISSISVMILYNLWVFGWEYKNIAPSVSKVNFTLSKELFSLGGKFFVIQLAGVVQFQTANIILIRYFGSEQVTNYNIAQKYFSIMPMIMAILLAPIWSAVTDAYVKQDYEWIHKTVSKYNKIALVIIGVGFGMLLVSESVYSLWIGDGRVIIDFQLSLWMFIFSSLMVYGSVYSIVLNGLGVLNIQFIACIFSPFIFLISTYILIHYFKLGAVAVILSSIIANYNGYLLGPWQYMRIRKSQKLILITESKKGLKKC